MKQWSRFLLAHGILLSICWSAVTVTAQVDPRCPKDLSGFTIPQKIPVNKEQTAILSKMFSGLSGSITDDRQESKMVVADANFTPIFSQLEADLSGALKLRDVPTVGTINLTDTNYTTPLIYNTMVDGRSVQRAVKVRVREYLAQSLDSGDIQRSSLTQKSKFLELKIQHYQYELSVIKPRLLVTDNDVKTIFATDASPGALADISQRAKSNPANAGLAQAGLVDSMIAFIREIPLHEPGFIRDFVKIRYERSSYQVRLPATNGQFVDVQITVDKNISLRDGKTDQILAQYPKDARVIEVKVPIAYAQLSEADLQLIPGLRAIKAFKDRANAQLMAGFVANSGKFSNSLRMAMENLPE